MSHFLSIFSWKKKCYKKGSGLFILPLFVQYLSPQFKVSLSRLTDHTICCDCSRSTQFLVHLKFFTYVISRSFCPCCRSWKCYAVGWLHICHSCWIFPVFFFKFILHLSKLLWRGYSTFPRNHNVIRFISIIQRIGLIDIVSAFKFLFVDFAFGPFSLYASSIQFGNVVAFCFVCTTGYAYVKNNSSYILGEYANIHTYKGDK